jgi:Rab-GTPase-TBC domain
VALCFSRDEWVRTNSAYEIHSPLVGHVEDEQGPTVAVPPNAVQPFLGLAMYFAPVCYVMKNRPSLYSTCRAMYASIWCKMNVLTSDSDTLLSVCKTFESLLIALIPRVFLHLIRLGVQPLQIAFPWMQMGFVTLLEMDQILHLWDRLLGYRDTNLLAVMAAAIFVYRAEPLLQVKNIICVISCGRCTVDSLLPFSLFHFPMLHCYLNTVHICQ